MKVFKREEIPDSYHIKNADYALDLLIIPKLESVQDFFVRVGHKTYASIVKS